jgi:hypothetical protein
VDKNEYNGPYTFQRIGGAGALTEKTLLKRAKQKLQRVNYR